MKKSITAVNDAAISLKRKEVRIYLHIENLYASLH